MVRLSYRVGFWKHQLGPQENAEGEMQIMHHLATTGFQSISTGTSYLVAVSTDQPGIGDTAFGFFTEVGTEFLEVIRQSFQPHLHVGPVLTSVQNRKLKNPP